MAELEVSKHAKKALQTISKKDGKGFWHKTKEFFLEIFIIVFAVSLSIWFHSLSEKSHQKEEVREFLTDLKSDLAADRQEILKSKQYITQKSEIDLKNVKVPGDRIVKIDSKALEQITIEVRIISRKTNSGNYEGFKSSGNIAYILNKSLKNKILKYYEQDMKFVEDKEQLYNRQLEKTVDIATSPSPSRNALTNNKIFLQANKEDVINKYNEILENNDAIVKEIDKELKE